MEPLAPSRANTLRRARQQRLRADVVMGVGTPAYLAQIEDAALIRSLYEELRGRRDVAGRRVLAAARDLAHYGRDLTVAAVARQAELDEFTAWRALARVRMLIDVLRKR